MKTRFENLIETAIDAADMDPDSAALCAYKAGRHDLAMPAVLEPHPDLVDAFRQGIQHSRNDAQDWLDFKAEASKRPS
jgi:hypothetical protein